MNLIDMKNLKTQVEALLEVEADHIVRQLVDELILHRGDTGAHVADRVESYHKFIRQVSSLFIMYIGCGTFYGEGEFQERDPRANLQWFLECLSQVLKDVEELSNLNLGTRDQVAQVLMNDVHMRVCWPILNMVREKSDVKIVMHFDSLIMKGSGYAG